MSPKSPGTFQLKSNGRIWDIRLPQVMGIINCTPDSFFSGNRFHATSDAIEQGIQMLNEGANALDIGGQSTRPNAKEVNASDEWERIAPVIQGIRSEFPNAILSIDTFHSDVAEKSLNAGAFMINDVFAGRKDPRLADVIRSARAPLVIMHMQGTPETMQKNPSYEDVQREVLDWLAHRCSALNEYGIEQLIVDPGFGFGKTVKHNFQLLHSLSDFHSLNCPLLVGISRKSMVWKSLDTTPEEALNGTTALHAWALERGTQILRVHDVKEAMETVKLFLQLHPH
jgi:dihydropteroate synthase